MRYSKLALSEQKERLTLTSLTLDKVLDVNQSKTLLLKVYQHHLLRQTEKLHVTVRGVCMCVSTKRLILY